MGIDRDDRDERQARVERMIDEFRRAQARRARVKDTVLDVRPEADTQTAVHGPECPATPAAPLTGK